MREAFPAPGQGSAACLGMPGGSTCPLPAALTEGTDPARGWPQLL